jgi:hypothetical protein
MRLDDYDGAAAIVAAWADGLRPDPSLTVSAWADIGPDARGLGPTVARSLQLDRRVVGEDRLAAQDMAAGGIGQRLQQCRRFADPIGECRDTPPGRRTR